MPCASVSAKRTFTSVEKPKSTAELSTIGVMAASALARLIRANQPRVVLTGAAGHRERDLRLPDFRSPRCPRRRWRRAGGWRSSTRGLTPYDRRADVGAPRRGRGGAAVLGDRSPQWTFPEQPAALAAVHAFDLVGNALPLAQRVAHHLGVAVWSPERDCLTHRTQSSSAYGTYDARKGEEVVTRRRRARSSSRAWRSHRFALPGNEYLSGPVSLRVTGARNDERNPMASRRQGGLMGISEE